MTYNMHESNAHVHMHSSLTLLQVDAKKFICLQDKMLESSDTTNLC